MVEKLTFISGAAALLDIPAANMPKSVAVLHDKRAHYRGAFYGGQPEAHLCNNHAV